MRDIQDGLRERLAEIAAKTQALESQLAELRQRESLLTALLEQEQRLGSAAVSKQATLYQSGNGNGHENGRWTSPLASFVLRAFAKQSECSLGQLKKAAMSAGIDFGNKNPGRAIHFLLVGMAQTGLVENMGDGNWRWKGDT